MAGRVENGPESVFATETRGGEDQAHIENATICRTVCRTFCVSWVIILGYILLGGLIFKLVETPQNISGEALNVNVSNADSEVTFDVEFQANITRANLINSLHDALVENRTNWASIAEGLLLDYETLVESRQVESRPIGDDSIYQTENAFSDWLNSCFFCLTVVTTIGYGHMFPLTPLGQVVCIFYAGFGIPIFFLYLAKLGELCALPVKRTYSAYSRWRARSSRWAARLKAEKMSTKNEHELDDVTAYKHNSDHVLKNGAPTGTPSTEYSKDDVALLSDGQELSDDDGDLGCSNSVRSEYSSEKSKDEDETAPFLETESTNSCQKTLRQNSHMSVISVQDYSNKNGASEADNFEGEVPVLVLSLILLVYILICSAVFSSVENWSYVESIYFCVITFSTIGFGDYVPGYDRAVKQLFVAFYIVIGMLITSACINLSQKRIAIFARSFFDCRFCNKPLSCVT